MPVTANIPIGVLLSRLGGTYGNWGGQGWSGGAFAAPGEDLDESVIGVDQLDEAFKVHDIEYRRIERDVAGAERLQATIAADKQLLSAMWDAQGIDITGQLYRVQAT